MYKTAGQIIGQVATEYGITTKKLLGADRNKTVVEARHKAMRMVKLQCGLSLSEISEIFDRDPSGVSRVLRSQF